MRRSALGETELKQTFHIAGARIEALLLPVSDGTDLVLAGRRHRVMLSALGEGEHRLEVDGVAHRVWIAARGDAIYVHAAGRSWTLEVVDELAETAAVGGAADTAVAPMPGTVVRVQVSAGEAVKRGQTLMVIESMKMETTIVAWRDGVVGAVHRLVGTTFDRKAPLVSLEPESS
jgi:acetyl/propionyl-CoA carboxylase alpha subunit